MEIAFFLLGTVVLALAGGLLWFILGDRRQTPKIADLLRNETDRLRQNYDEQARGLRVELAGTLTTQIGAVAAGQEMLRQAVENRLDAIRSENTTKLEEMRQTVDQKLQTTLETKLTESFDRVAQQLRLVHQGIGEMQTLAAGVSDLRKVLSNVRIRGTFGENQAAQLLEQFLSPEQFILNAQVRENSQERVEFAVRLPGRDDEGDVLLPIDAKFPREDYERLLAAAEIGDSDAVEEAGKALENRVKLFARTIREKYINPPRTTDFAILFLPTEGLYAEILRRPGLFDQIQRDCHVTLTGPTTFVAYLNALQMGFRSLAIQKRSSEVWRLLGAVQAEFGNYDAVVTTLAKQLQTAANSVKKLNTRSNVMRRKLKDVEKISQAEAGTILGGDFALAAPEEPDDPDNEMDE